MKNDLQDSIAFAKQIGKHSFIAVRKRDGYRTLVVAPGATREDARAEVLAEFGDTWEVTDAE